MLYAAIGLFNISKKTISSFDATILKMVATIIVLLTYCMLTVYAKSLTFSAITVILLLVLGIFNTVTAYCIYFCWMKNLKSQNVAIFSYFDPILAVVISAVRTDEPMFFFNIIGAVMILGAAFFSENVAKRLE